MPNQGTFVLDLIGVEGKTIRDPNTNIQFRRASDQQVIAAAQSLRFPPAKKFKLPAYPQAQNLYADIAPTRYRTRKSDFFTLTHNQTLTQQLQMLREPQQWQASFVAWQQLPKHFKALQRVLERSPNISVKEKSSLVWARFTEAAYDGVTDEKAILAKTALLNLYAKMTALKEPVQQQQNWFAFVIRILQIGRERLIAVVDPQMEPLVRTIRENLNQYPEYKNTNARNHLDNVAAAVPAGYKVLKSKMVSLKSDEEHGNLQLTLAPAKNEEGEQILLLDADIDENGNLLRHLCDVFKHAFTGGTHPHDIHEYLALAQPQTPLGYNLI